MDACVCTCMQFMCVLAFVFMCFLCVCVHVHVCVYHNPFLDDDKNQDQGTEQVTQRLRALAALAEGLGSILAPTWQLTTVYNFNPGDQMPSPGLQGSCTYIHTYMHAYIHTHTYRQNTHTQTHNNRKIKKKTSRHVNKWLEEQAV